MPRFILALLASLLLAGTAQAQHPSRGVIAGDPPAVVAAIRDGYTPWRVAGGNPTKSGFEAEILRQSGWPEDVQREFLARMASELPRDYVLQPGHRLDFNSSGGVILGTTLTVEHNVVVAFPGGSVQGADLWVVYRQTEAYYLAVARLCHNLDGWRGEYLPLPPPPGPPVGNVPKADCPTCCKK